MKALILSSRYQITGILLIALLIVASVFKKANEGNHRDDYIAHQLPANLELREEGPQQYVVTTDYFNHDYLGNFTSKSRVKGQYTRGFEDGTVQWEDVTIAHSIDAEAAFPEGEAIEYMEGFTYTPSVEMVNPNAFPGWPLDAFFAKNLVWDMLGMEGFAWAYWNELRLNEPFKADQFNFEVPLAGAGSFTNKDIVLTYAGVSQMNNETCALILYNAMDNALKVDTEHFKMNGRSHYWGSVWVSLEDKQIEHATLFEDVNMEMTMPGQTEPQLTNATRKIVFEKINPNL